MADATTQQSQHDKIISDLANLKQHAEAARDRDLSLQNIAVSLKEELGTVKSKLEAQGVQVDFSDVDARLAEIDSTVQGIAPAPTSTGDATTATGGGAS